MNVGLKQGIERGASSGNFNVYQRQGPTIMVVLLMSRHRG